MTLTRIFRRILLFQLLVGAESFIRILDPADAAISETQLVITVRLGGLQLNRRLEVLDRPLRIALIQQRLSELIMRIAVRRLFGQYRVEQPDGLLDRKSVV